MERNQRGVSSIDNRTDTQSWRSVHDDVQQEDLHWIERIRQSEESGDGDEGERGDSGRKLEDEEILNVEKDTCRIVVSNCKTSRQLRLTLALLDSWQESSEIIVDENDIGSFLRDVRSTSPHRHTDISHLQRRCIVHCSTKRSARKKEKRERERTSISSHRNDRPPHLERLNNRHLMPRCRPGKDSHSLNPLDQLSLTQ